ncbi:MAG: hypothetical protein ACJ0DG_03035 [bacterium]
MKQIVKMMLAAVSSIALATSAYAWDFSASGSSSAKWMTQTSKAGAADAVTQANFSSSSGGVTVSSSNSDGANSATFSYTADWNGDDGNFDEYVKVSGSKKVGNWTASSSTTQHIQKDVTGAANQAPMTAGGTAAITLTDGSITYKLGDAAHLSTSEKAVNGPMSGAQDAEARVDSFNGFSVGLGVGPGTLTVALDHNAGAATTALGDLSTAVACGGQSTGFGLNFSGNVGVDLSFTYGSGSNAISSTNCTGDNASNAASANTMGLAVGMPMGNMSLALDYESSATSNTAATVETKMAKSGFEISVTMSGIADGTAGINVSSQTVTNTVGAADAVDSVNTGTELWWTVPIGPVSLAVGYGASSAKVGEADPTTVTQMGAEMSMSF